MRFTRNSLGKRARRLWIAVRCRLRGARRLRELIGGLGPACERLADFGHHTDEQFTALARSLGTLNQQFSEMKRELQVLDDVLNDRDQTHAVGAARSLCKNSIELVHASLGVSDTVRERMTQVDAGLQRTCAMREEFDKSFLLLRTVAMGFRVEAARVDAEFQGVFANVAAAISDIDRRIAASTAGAFSQIENLLAESASERETINAGDAGTFVGAQTAIQAVRNDLDALQSALVPCAHATTQIVAEVGRSGPLVLEVLRALQFQDIVRQRLEHVSDGLQDIGRTAKQAAGHECRELAFFGHAARIQAGQLVSARREIGRAGDEVTGGLGALLNLGSEILGHLSGLEKMVAQALGSDRMAAMFSREIGQLAQVAATSERASRRVTGQVERIGSVIAVFSEEIEKQVREVKLVALNAQVAAARLPCAGALEKLAEETTRISRENASISKELAVNLRSTLECLKGIRVEADEFLAAVATEKAVIERGAVEIGGALRHHSEEVRRISADLRRQFGDVQTHLSETLQSVNFPAQIDGCFAPVEELCRQIEDEAGEDALEVMPTDTRLESHAARYTMEQERDTHRAASAGQPIGTTSSPPSGPAAAAAPAATPAAAPESAGGDIELF